MYYMHVQWEALNSVIHAIVSISKCTASLLCTFTLVYMISAVSFFAQIQGRKGLIPAGVISELHTLCEPKHIIEVSIVNIHIRMTCRVSDLITLLYMYQ